MHLLFVTHEETQSPKNKKVHLLCGARLPEKNYSDLKRLLCAGMHLQICLGGL